MIRSLLFSFIRIEITIWINRDNLDWLRCVTNWAKLTATASLDVIHHGHEKEAWALMVAYLPREVAATFSEGGGLDALGLIHANITEYLLQQLKEASNDVITDSPWRMFGPWIG